MRRPLPALALVAALGLLGACGGTGTTSSTATGPAAASSASPSEVDPGALAASAALASGGGAVPSASAPAGPLKVQAVAVAPLKQALVFAMRPGDPMPWVGLQTGQLLRLVDGKASDPVLDVSGEITSGGERGLLGLAFSPDGREAYLDVTTKGHGDTAVWAYPVTADGSFDTAGRRTLLTQVQPFANHNGGHLVTGPDGMLYVGFGDGGSGGDPQRNGQKLSTFLGKILRIDPRVRRPYGVPGDNPFIDTVDAKPEIWISGVRNPWRFSFDPANGDLWIGDVGQDEKEEVDRLTPAQARGANLGWSRFEGTDVFHADVADDPAMVKPVYEYSHRKGEGCSITGGAVYRGKAIPALVGSYLFSDFCKGGVKALKDGKVTTLNTTLPAVASFGVDAAGEVYVLSLSAGVFRLQAG